MKSPASPSLGQSYYQAAFENADLALFVLNSDLAFLEVNRQACELLGCTREEMLGLSARTLFPPELTDRLASLCQSPVEGQEIRLETEALRKDGVRAPASVVAKVINTPEGQRILTSLHDLTAHKQADDRFRLAVESAPNAMVAVNQAGQIILVNSQTERLFGYTREELIGQPVELLVPERFRHRHPAYRADFSAAPQTRAMGAGRDLYGLRKDGSEVPVEIGLNPIEVEGEVLVLSSVVDITERKRAEEALRASQAQLAGIIGSAKDAIITIDASQRVTLFNAAAEQMFGRSAAEALGQPIDRFIPDRFRRAHQAHVQDFGRTNVTKRQMGRLGTIYGLRASGEEFPVEASISQVEAGGQKLYTVILRDITERQRAEEQLREQATLLDHARDAILVQDLADRIRYWNKSAERLYGWTAEEALDQDLRELVYPGNAPQFAQAKQAVIEKGEWVGELRQTTKDGKELVAEGHWTLVRDDAGRPKFIFVINTDITEKKKLEAQFLRAQRMESIGTLAGGIAHDLNNILSPVLMAVQMLQLRFADEESQRWLQLLHTNAERGAEMVKQVLSFARGIEGERIALQPKHLIKEIVKILRETLPKSIEIRFSIQDDLWPVAGDATQLHQVLMNLCVNARDAMPHGGRLLIGAENIHLDENYARMHLEAKPGRFVAVTVADTGMGIPAEVINKIFDPFFTTKAHGQGTGLGLSTALGIVKGHGGFVNVYSEVGKGTQFKLHLPAIASAQAGQVEAEPPELPVGHGEWILVVDDEAAIREITKGTLETFGYRVLTASDGTEAIALFAQDKDKIKVVLTDMVMPYLDGPATIRALQKLDPQVRIIATSGLTANGKVVEATQAGVKIFLSKPYTADKLLKAIAEILSAE